MTNLEKYVKAFSEALEVPEGDVPALKDGESDQWDSVGHMTLIAALEDAFDIMVDMDDIIDLSSFEKGKEILRKYDVEVSTASATPRRCLTSTARAWTTRSLRARARRCAGPSAGAACALTCAATPSAAPWATRAWWRAAWRPRCWPPPSTGSCSPGRDEGAHHLAHPVGAGGL